MSHLLFVCCLLFYIGVLFFHFILSCHNSSPASLAAFHPTIGHYVKTAANTISPPTSHPSPPPLASSLCWLRRSINTSGDGAATLKKTRPSILILILLRQHGAGHNSLQRCRQQQLLDWIIATQLLFFPQCWIKWRKTKMRCRKNWTQPARRA